MSGRIYTAPFENIAVAAAQDVFNLITATNVAVLVHHLRITFNKITDERLRFMIHRGSTTGSGGAAITPSPRMVGAAAASSTVRRNDTTQSTDGTVLWAEQVSVLTPFEILFTPETQPFVAGGTNRYVISLEAAPAASINVSGALVFEELS